MSKRYVILGTSVYGIENMGDEALLNVLIRDLRKIDSDCHITWVSRHKNDELGKLYGVNEVIIGLEHETKEASNGRWFNGLNFGDNTEHLKVLGDRISKADALIIGGDPFQQITLSFNRGLAPYAANLITLAKFYGVKTVLYSIHMGVHLTDGYAKELTKFCIENADLTTLREEFSLDILNDMGLNTTNCKVVADSAWALDLVDKSNSVFDSIDGFNIDWLQDKIIGVNIRHNYWQWSDRKWSKIKKNFSKFLDSICEKNNSKILFIPNCTYDIDHKMEGDILPHFEIYEMMQNKHNAFCIENKLNLWETLSLFPFLWAHMSNRRHSAIFAAVNRVPVLPLGGAWHVRPAFEEVDLGMNFIEPEFWTVFNLEKSFNDIISRRKNIVDKYNEVIPSLRERAQLQAKLISEL